MMGEPKKISDSFWPALESAARTYGLAKGYTGQVLEDFISWLKKKANEGAEHHRSSLPKRVAKTHAATTAPED
jgi:hypothetical protein